MIQPGQRFSHYEVLELLGAGGMGVVYKARDLRLKRTVALKLLQPSAADREGARRFLREAESAASLNHPRIAQVFEADEHDGVLFLAMEYLPGGSVRDEVARQRPSPQRIVGWGIDVAAALAEAHRHGIVHRDVKPSNILLGEDGRPKIADFGLAKRVAPGDREGPTRTALTAAGVFVGTPSYMSPEQLRGLEVGPPADVFSFGCLLYELVAGRAPFDRATDLETLNAAMTEPAPPLPPGTPAGLAVLIGHCLEKEPEDRPTAAALVEGLRTVAAAWSAVAAAPGPVPAAPAPARRRPVRRAMVIGAVALVVGLALLASWLPREPTFGFKERDTILVGSVSNATGDPLLEGTLATALQISLEQSQYVTLLSPARVTEALQRMRKEAGDKLTEDVAREVCQREGARALLTGTVALVDSQYLLTVRVVDPASGSAVRSFSARAGSRPEILSAVDSLAAAVRAGLGESLASIGTSSRRLADATTSSVEALKNYGEASQLLERGRVEVARTLLQRAVELDPEFARAYATLGTTYKGYGLEIDADQAEHYFQEALKRLDRVSERERLEIQALYHGAMGRYQQAANFYRLLVERHPNVDGYHFYLARQYQGLEQYAEAIREYEQASSLNPRSSRTLVLLASCYGMLNQQKMQRTYLAQAFALDPEWETDDIQNHQYGWSLIVEGQEDLARAAFRKMLGKGGAKRARGCRSLAILALYHGQLREARRQFEEAIRINELAGALASAARDRLYLGEALVLMERPDEAVRELERGAGLVKGAGYAPAWLTVRFAALYARTGRLAEASRLIDAGRAKARLDDPNAGADVLRAEGEWLLARGDRDEGVERLRRAALSRGFFLFRYSLARALARAHHVEEATELYEKLVAGLPEPWEGHVAWAVAHRDLGRLYEERGDIERARSTYVKLSGLWKDADGDLPPVRDLRAKLARVVR